MTDDTPPFTGARQLADTQLTLLETWLDACLALTRAGTEAGEAAEQAAGSDARHALEPLDAYTRGAIDSLDRSRRALAELLYRSAGVYGGAMPDQARLDAVLEKWEAADRAAVEQWIGWGHAWLGMLAGARWTLPLAEPLVPGVRQPARPGAAGDGAEGTARRVA